MLLGFGAKNFFSFKEGFSISLKNKNNISSVLAIKGANASGKTNIIKVLSFLHSFVTNSFTTLKPDEEIMVFDSIEDMKEKINFLLVNPKLCKNMASKAYKTSLQYTYLKRAKTMCQLHDSIVSSEDIFSDCLDEIEIESGMT